MEIIATGPVGPTITLEVKELPGFPGRFITADGRVFNEVKPGSNGRYKTTYYRPRKTRGKHGHTRQVTGLHIAVAEAWIGPPPFPGAVVRHKDDDPGHNHFENLIWGSQRDNMHDAIERGRRAIGSKAGGAKLTEEAVADIKARVDAGETQRSLAREYAVSQATVNHIIHGKVWRHVA